MNIALVLAGGSGSRVGAGCPKQYLEVNGRPMIAFCLETLSQAEEIDGLWIVAEEQWRNLILQSVDTGKIKGFSRPGENRQLSICQGLEDIAVFYNSCKESKDQAVCRKDTILIHDAARPLLTKALIARCYEALQGHDGVMPVLPMKDTVYYSEDGKQVTSLLDRSRIYAGQAPELFDFQAYYRVCKAMSKEQLLRINGSTESAIQGGLDVVMIAGEEGNVKITTMEDWEKFCRERR